MAKWMMVTLIGMILVVPSLAFAQQTPQGADQGDLQVVRDAVATGISNREPMSPGQAFPPSLGQIYYFTEVRSPSPGTEIAHVWYYGEREVARVTLPIAGTRWRTWSSKQIPPGWTGQWKVEAVTTEGTVLAFKAFSVKAALAAGPEKK